MANIVNSVAIAADMALVCPMGLVNVTQDMYGQMPTAAASHHTGLETAIVLVAPHVAPVFMELAQMAPVCVGQAMPVWDVLKWCPELTMEHKWVPI